MDAEISDNIENDESNVDESDEDLPDTAEKMLQDLENAWLNEKFAPELLPHRAVLIEMGLNQIAYMEENIKKVTRDDIRFNIHTMEICRIRFIISSYLRKRLEKIEEFAIQLLDEEAKGGNSVMTSEESLYASEYLSHMQTLFTTVTLQHLPQKFSELKLQEIASQPNLDKHVFVKANKDIKGIFVSEHDEEVDFDEDSQHIIKYSAIAQFVKNRNVQLV